MSFFKTSSKSSSSASSSTSSTLLREEINFENIDQSIQSIDNWKIPKHPVNQIYDSKWYQSQWNLMSNYTIKTEEQTIALHSDYEEIKLLSKKNIFKHLSDKYNYLHFGLIQVAAKPLTREGLDTSLLIALRDCRFLNFNDSLLGMVETSLCDGPVYFDCYPNFTVSLHDKNILDTLTLNIKTENYKTKVGSLPVAILFRIQYKAMTSAFSTGALKTQKKGETVLFQTDLGRSQLTIPRAIPWSQVTLPQQWLLPNAAPSLPVQNKNISDIQQFPSGAVQIRFERSFSQRIPTSSNNPESFYAPSRHSVSSQSSTQFQHLDNSRIPQARYTVQTESSSVDQDDQPKSPTYSTITDSTPFELNVLTLENDFKINNEYLRKDFYSEENLSKRNSFFEKFDSNRRKEIQENYYSFLNSIKKHVFFFEWFQSYSEKSINVLQKWKTTDGELSAEFPPNGQLDISFKNKEVKATPFKQRIGNDPINAKDFQNVFEQNNYTNKYLQTIGEYLISTNKSPSTSQSSHSSNTSFPRTPLFKPYEIPNKFLPTEKPLSDLEKRLLRIEKSFQTPDKSETGSTSERVEDSYSLNQQVRAVDKDSDSESSSSSSHKIQTTQRQVTH